MSEQLFEILKFLPFLNAEGILSGGILLLTFLGFWRHIHWQVIRVILMGVILTTAVVAFRTPSAAIDWLAIDPVRITWKLLIDGAAATILLFTFDRHIRMKGTEFGVLLLTLLLGSHLLIMSTHLFMVYLSIEILSLTGYMLVAFPLFRKNIVSGFKYLVFGGVTSAIMLYGISLLYGIAGDLSLNMAVQEGPLFKVAVLFFTFGLLFKISAAPFHLWVPDVYEGTAYPILAILSIVPKLAAFAFLTHWTNMIDQPVYVIGILAIVTLVAGNFGALQQSSVRRLMGFSSIAHSGFMLLGLLQPPELLMFYAGIYALMTIGTFQLLNHYNIKYGLDSIDDYQGMRHVSRLKTLYIVIWMIALTGLPPTAGFTAKLLLFTGLGEVYGASQDTFILVLIIVGILNAVISLAYYLKIPFKMIFKPVIHTTSTRENKWSFSNLFGTILVLLVIILFIMPEWLMSWLNNANFVL